MLKAAFRWAFVAPATLWLLVFFLIPVGMMTVLSLWQYSDHTLTATWDLENYKRFLSQSQYLKSLYLSLEVAVVVAIVSLLLAYPAAYALAFAVPKRWQRITLVLAFIPFWTSYVVRSYAWQLVLSKTGVVNEFLLATGIIDAALVLSNSRVATITGFVHFFVMLLILTIFISLTRIPPNLRQASADLGATPLQTFWNVTLPLSMPGVLVGVFLTIVITIGDFITPEILGGGKELLMPQAIMLQIQRHFDFPMASTISVIMMLAVIAASLACFARYKFPKV